MIASAILAGGRGSRLKVALGAKPKVLAPVSGRPFLAYLLDMLLDAGVRKVVLCTGYLGEQVQLTFGNRYAGLELQYSREDKPLGTAGALRLALPLLDSDPVLILNGDSFCYVDFQRLLSWHRDKKAIGSVVLVRVPDVSRFGRVVLGRNGEIERLDEKGGCGSGWINAGVYLLSQRLLGAIPEGCPMMLEDEVFPAWTGSGLYGYQVGDRFLDIGTPASYEGAESFFTGDRRARAERDEAPRG